MATYTRNQLVRDVLLEVGVIDANETPSADDYETVDDRAQQKLEELYEDELIPFDLDGEIPARFHLALVRVIAETVYGSYGKSAQAQEFVGNAANGMKTLRKIRQRAYIAVPTQATYY